MYESGFDTDIFVEDTACTQSFITEVSNLDSDCGNCSSYTRTGLKNNVPSEFVRVISMIINENTIDSFMLHLLTVLILKYQTNHSK